HIYNMLYKPYLMFLLIYIFYFSKYCSSLIVLIILCVYMFEKLSILICQYVNYTIVYKYCQAHMTFNYNFYKAFIYCFLTMNIFSYIANLSSIINHISNKIRILLRRLFVFSEIFCH